MSEETPVTLAGGAVSFPWPEKRIREYCRAEVYVGYDDRHAVDDTVTPNDIDASRRLFSGIDRYGNESQFLVNSRGIQRALSRVPDAELGELTDDEWAALRVAAGALIDEFIAIPGVALAKTGKILHLKRPRLFPIMDSYVVELLTGLPAQGIPKGRQRETALTVMDAVRGDLKGNADAYESLKSRLSDLPIPLTPVRMHDILAWSYWKWDRLRNLLAVRYEPALLGYRQVKSAVKTSLLTPPEPPKTQSLRPIAKAEKEIEADGVNMIRVETLDQFDSLFNEYAGYIVIQDTATGTKIHRISCRHVNRDSFNRKVVYGKGKTGAYYWCRAAGTGLRTGAKRCTVCLIPG